MAANKYRSRTQRRVFVKTPGGETRLTYRKRKESKQQCGECGADLKGIPRVKISKLSKTQRRPERPYGGVLCSKCMRKKMVEKVLKLLKGEAQ